MAKRTILLSMILTVLAPAGAQARECFGPRLEPLCAHLDAAIAIAENAKLGRNARVKGTRDYLIKHLPAMLLAWGQEVAVTGDQAATDKLEVAFARSREQLRSRLLALSRAVVSLQDLRLAQLFHHGLFPMAQRTPSPLLEQAQKAALRTCDCQDPKCLAGAAKAWDALIAASKAEQITRSQFDGFKVAERLFRRCAGRGR